MDSCGAVNAREFQREQLERIMPRSGETREGAAETAAMENTLAPIVSVNGAIRRNGRTHVRLTGDLHPKRNPLIMGIYDRRRLKVYLTPDDRPN